MTLSLPTNPNSAVPDSLSGSRKRQRSQSMQSNASSPKRSASEDPSVPLRDSRVQNDTTDTDITMRTTSPEPDQNTNQTPVATIDPTTIDTFLNRPLHIGEFWYIVSKRWLDRWRKACTGQADKVDGVILESDLGPPDRDNPSFIDENEHLLTNVAIPTLVFLPREAWDFFVQKYGSASSPLPRRVVPRGISKTPEIELHPHLLRPVRLIEQSEGDHGPKLPPVAVSAGNTLAELVDALGAPFKEVGRKHRVWTDVYIDDYTGYPRAKLVEDRAKLVPESDELVEDKFQSGDNFAVEFQENGDWLVDANKIESGSSLVLVGGDTTTPPPLFKPGGGFYSTSFPGAKNSDTKTPVAKAAAKSTAVVASSSKSGQEPGTLGLGNMGNTCFMNSALQCLAHTKELCQYFVSGVFETELNPDNPLGMHGAIANTFGALLQRIWSSSAASSSYSPREFKQQLQRFAPQFIGYQQHDSQELVAFLLDGLHEDLNRILKKPYVEKPDWEGGGDKELVELAKKSWDGYLQRNDSVIVDLFQGQYKSTLVCPECEKVSITFDPFMYLTLPLPIQKKWWHQVFYVPWDPQAPLRRMMVEISRDASFKDLKKLVARWMNSSADNLFVLEVFQHRFYKNLEDHIACSEAADNDLIVIYELPCNSQQSRAYKKQPEDPFIVPVYTHEGTQTRTTYGRGSLAYFGYPFIAVIDQETAKDKETIYNNVVERLEQWAGNSRDLYTWEGSLPGSPDSMMEEVPIPITGLPLVDAVTEIKENGEVVTFQETPEEGDITDEKSTDVQEDLTTFGPGGELKKLGPKPNIFDLTVQNTSTPFASGFHLSSRSDSWEKREQGAVADDEIDQTRGPLLRVGDVLMCEFDTHMKDYYFPDIPSTDSQLWSIAKEFVHPEFLASKKADAAKSKKGITLQDCLDEFTKEEKLGEDDLWYCPRCKKHQQATKRFDLWKVPDVLVVHLKRFSNNRTLRDKIDTLVDFPVEGLDLDCMVGERIIANKLAAGGHDLAALGLTDVEEPLVYDLYAVDEHLGGLGGGHYRAYALNHANNNWYHFDDSYVRESRAEDSVNSNAYLLFYKRRSIRPLGGKTHEIIEAAGMNADVPWPKAPEESQETELQDPYLSLHGSPEVPGFATFSQSPKFDSAQPLFGRMLDKSGQRGWSPTTSNSSPPALEDDPPSFDDAQNDPLTMASYQFDFPDPNFSKSSPTSSNEALSNGNRFTGVNVNIGVSVTRDYDDDWDNRRRPTARLDDSPPASTSRSTTGDDDVNPFIEEEDKVPVVEIPVDESTLNDIDL